MWEEELKQRLVFEPSKRPPSRCDRNRRERRKRFGYTCFISHSIIIPQFKPVEETGLPRYILLMIQFYNRHSYQVNRIKGALNG